MEPSMLPPEKGEKDSLITCRNSQGAELRGTLLRLTRFLVVFEVYNPYSILQLSEVLSEFKIIINERMVYSGRGVVSNLVNTGIMLVCEATLDESWIDVDLFSPLQRREKLSEELLQFISEFEKNQKILDSFKVAVADMQILLMGLRIWLEQVELSIRSEPTADRHALELEVIRQLEPKIVEEVFRLFERLDSIANSVESALFPAHRAYARRLLHPLLLCSPFVYRTYNKPLGYAGDYEMVNMILRAPYEGASLFAKMVNLCFLKNPPAEAHRNRIIYLRSMLEQEAERGVLKGRRVRVLNIGCGPAWELQEFIRSSTLSDHVDCVLLDFNEETLRHAESVLTTLKKSHDRAIGLQTVIRSVHQILKDAVRSAPFDRNGGFDIIYCAGLFDYMADRTCKRLMNLFYTWLNPGGLLVATNVDAAKPFRRSMEIILEWHLICRDSKQFLQLAPDSCPLENRRLLPDPTGVNLMLEARKP